MQAQLALQLQAASPHVPNSPGCLWQSSWQDLTITAADLLLLTLHRASAKGTHRVWMYPSPALSTRLGAGRKCRAKCPFVIPDSSHGIKPQAQRKCLSDSVSIHVNVCRLAGRFSSLRLLYSLKICHFPGSCSCVFEAHTSWTKWFVHDLNVQSFHGKKFQHLKLLWVWKAHSDFTDLP